MRFGNLKNVGREIIIECCGKKSTSAFYDQCVFTSSLDLFTLVSIFFFNHPFLANMPVKVFLDSLHIPKFSSNGIPAVPYLSWSYLCTSRQLPCILLTTHVSDSISCAFPFLHFHLIKVPLPSHARFLPSLPIVIKSSWALKQLCSPSFFLRQFPLIPEITESLFSYKLALPLNIIFY